MERDRCAPEDFYSTTNHRTLCARDNEWVDVQNQRMDALVVVKGDEAFCRRLRDIRAGDRGGSGHARHPCYSGIEGARPAVVRFHEQRHIIRTSGGNGCAANRRADRTDRAPAQGIVVVAGPVVVHTGGVRLSRALIRDGYVDALLSGNALGVHDIESALLGTSLGIRQSDGRQEEHGHRNHMRAINAIYHCGSIPGAVACGRLQSGIMYECVKARSRSCWPAASRRRSAPGHDHRYEQAQDAYAKQLRGAGLVFAWFDVALHRDRQHAAELGENRVRRY